MAWFESYVLRLVFLDSSLQSPGQEKHFGILFIPLRVVVREIQLSVETYSLHNRVVISINVRTLGIFGCSNP